MPSLVKKVLPGIFLSVIVFWSAFLVFQKERAASIEKNLHPALFWESLGNGMVRCNLCPRHCILSPGQIGVCRARKNIKGKLYSIVYGKVAAAHLDPVEKKPLFHFLPSSQVYSISTTGCNLQCKFCQNWQISQSFPWQTKTIDMTPSQVVENALEQGAKAIAFTYGEPTIFYEFMLDTAKLAHQKGLKTIVVSAGYINQEPLKKLLPYIDAYKIDLKGIRDDFYQQMTTGSVKPVLETIKTIKNSGTWLEIVNLLIPGVNDSDEDIRELVRWVKENVGEDVPLHFTRFHPDYKLLNLYPTPVETLKRARKIAMDMGMKYVYTGNIFDIEGSTTFCPRSHKPAIVRDGFFVTEYNLDDKGQCPTGEKIPGVWK